ncbi:MAG: nitroreductase Nfs [Candidatus Heimdallarchaeota archaeon]|nr:nitroreductase Nfs [Candidatus Heimdallarchaeota archaeon]
MEYHKSINELIHTRISRRNYQNIEIEPSKLMILEKELKKPFTGLFGNKSLFKIIDTKISDPEKKVKIGTYGMISGARYFIYGVTQREKYNIIDYGYSFEKIILKATEMELGTCWLGAKFVSKDLLEHIMLKENEFIPAISPIGHPLKKSTFKESFISWGIKARKRKPWSEIFFLGDFNEPLTEKVAGKFATPLEWVRLGPSGKNIQQWRIVKEKDNDIFHFYIEKIIKTQNNTLSKLVLLDIGIALCHFNLGVLSQKISGKFYVEEPNISFAKRNVYYIASWATSTK